jgi:phosphoglycerate dehydrogenase-like enzyme
MQPQPRAVSRLRRLAEVVHPPAAAAQWQRSAEFGVSPAAVAATVAPPAIGDGGASGLTIGICHGAYPVVPVLQKRLPHITSVFQEWSLDAMLPRMSEVDILCVSGFWDDAMLENATKLKYIQSIGVGYNQFPLGELEKRGIVLSNAVGVNSPAVAEHAIALILSISRKLSCARDNQHRKHWRSYISDPLAREFELRGRTVGIVGLGAIGTGVARLAKAFGCTVLATKGNPATHDSVADTVLPPAGLPQLLTESDFVVLTCPLSEATTGLIGAAELSMMKESASLINCARGAVVDETVRNQCHPTDANRANQCHCMRQKHAV